MDNQVRIIAGLFRGKKISFPSTPELRPTADRIRETLFNWLMHDIRGASCLDAFAGSGALGFEACSRGAKEVILLESSLQIFKALEKSAENFKANVVLKNIDTLSFLQSTTKVFDIVFLDPPFNSDYLNTCLDFLARSTCLKNAGLVYIESSRKIELDLCYWQVIKEKKAGQVYYGLVEKL